MEVDQNGNILGRYTQGAGIDEPLAELRPSTTSFYEQDGLGSVTSLSASAGSLSNTYVYKAFWNLASSSGTMVNPFQYTARDYDPETGLRYYRARYYDGNTGRFLSEDPARWEVGYSWYAYVGNNPTNYLDWDGRKGSKMPPPNLPQGTPQNEVNLFNGGWNTMIYILSQKNCQKFFYDRSHKTPDQVLQILQDTQYSFQPVPGGPDTGAQTNSEKSVFLNNQGVFVTATDG